MVLKWCNIVQRVEIDVNQDGLSANAECQVGHGPPFRVQPRRLQNAGLQGTSRQDLRVIDAKAMSGCWHFVGREECHSRAMGGKAALVRTLAARRRVAESGMHQALVAADSVTGDRSDCARGLDTTKIVVDATARVALLVLSGTPQIRPVEYGAGWGPWIRDTADTLGSRRDCRISQMLNASDRSR